MKKRNVLLLLFGMLAVSAAVAVVSVSANRTNELAFLALENVEALSAKEGAPPVGQYTGNVVYYTFNGDHWEGTYDSSLTRQWFPSYATCTDYSDPNKTGGSVYCSTGRGNCWNGTSCIFWYFF